MNHELGIMDKKEKILIKALELHERGRKPAEILAMFPEAKAEIKELFAAMEMFGNAKKHINPEPRLLHEILKKIETKEEQILFVHRRRFHFRQTIVPVGALALLLIVILSSLGSAPGISNLAENPLDLNAIKAEAAQADFNPDLYTFLEEEKQLEEIDAALADF
ncbi:MAG TPA: hypothetical protein VJB92_01200 [Candidatus Paceibacterota bacterium]